MREVVIASAARTPVGSFLGALSTVSAVDLGVVAVKAAIERAGITPDRVDETVFGCVLQAGLGQGVARQVAVHAGISVEKPAFTVNMICGSGLKTIQLAAQAIALGDAEIVVAGGTENMSLAPHVLMNSRMGTRMGSGIMIDTMVNDGLTDAFNGYHMGVTAENLAEQYDISRLEQDTFSADSQRKAVYAQEQGYFDAEIVPVEVKTRKGSVIVDKDEHMKAGTTVESLGKLKTVFKKEGTVTAGNASGINDGAAALVLMSAEKAKELGIEPLAVIKGYASAGVEPSHMGYGPVPAVKKALEKAQMTLEGVDLIEANEAFAAQALAVAKGLDLNMEKVNVNGGAIALGHPVGASGARILTTLLYEMKRRNAKTGLATLCIGGGMGTAVVVSR